MTEGRGRGRLGRGRGRGIGGRGIGGRGIGGRGVGHYVSSDERSDNNSSVTSENAVCDTLASNRTMVMGRGVPKQQLCKYFARGRCRDGRRCRFSHELPQQQLVSPEPENPTTLSESKSDATLDLVATECISELKLISNVIDDSLASSHNDNCVNCNQYSMTMVDLQSQAQIAMKRMNMMVNTLATLQTESSLVQQSLETLFTQLNKSSIAYSTVNGTSSPYASTLTKRNGGTGSRTEVPTGNGERIHVGQQVLVELNDGGKSQSLSTNSMKPPTTQTTVNVGAGSRTEVPVSSKERIHVRQQALVELNDGDKSQSSSTNSTTALIAEAWKKNGSSEPTEAGIPLLHHQMINTLDELILRCSLCINGSPSKFTNWLREELDVNSITDLGEAITECPEKLLEGGVHDLAKFTEAVTVCTDIQQHKIVDVRRDSQQGTFEPIEVEGVGAVVIMNETQADASESNNADWTCPLCTVINPKLFLTCGTCGSTAECAVDKSDCDVAELSARNSSTSSMTNKLHREGVKDRLDESRKKHEEEAELAFIQEEEQVAAEARRIAAEAEKHMRLEEKARKKHEKVEQKKADLARKKEEARVAAEVERISAETEKQRRLEAKREKQMAIMRYEAEVQQQQQFEQVHPNEDDQKTAVPTLNVQAAPFLPRSISSMSLQAANKNGTPSGISRFGEISYYIKKNNGKQTKNVSPIFDLLQKESTVEKGRRLLILEAKTFTCKKVLRELTLQKSRLEQGIQADENFIKDSEEEIIELDRKVSNRFGWLGSWTNIFDSKQVDSLLDEEDNKIDDEVNQQLAALTSEVKHEVECSLEELINNCATFLTGPFAADYVLYLHSEGINTIEDLSHAIIERDCKLFGGNESVGIKSESKEAFIAIVHHVKSKNDSVHRATLVEKELANDEKEKNERRERKQRAKKIREEAADKKMSRHQMVKKARERTEILRNLIPQSEASIKSMREQLADLQTPILDKTKELEKLRDDISDVKGKKMQEDSNFHIDRSRDSRGFSFLMIAAQNNDLVTAKTCLELGADAYAKSPEGLTAIDFSFFFDHQDVTNVILNHGGTLPQKQSDAWKSLLSMVPQRADLSKSWDDALKVAELAALPAEVHRASPEKCEADEDMRMNVLTAPESNMDFTCFESRLIDPHINSNQVQRVVLLDQKVYNWCLSADKTTRLNFVNVLEGLKPESVRRPCVGATKVHRRAIVGTTTTFEVLASRFQDVSNNDKKTHQVVLFSPFVSGEVEGVSSIGVIVWAVASDAEASLYKTLIANTEFMRNKVALDDRFLSHKDGVLELGKDMHLLDIQSTSIWTTTTMGLYILNVDRGDLDRVSQPGFTAKKRIVHSEAQVNKLIFTTSQDETKENEGILASERLDMSSLISGGAGTGKTLLMIRKVACEEPSRRVLLVTRLPRLMNIIKTAVEEKRQNSVDNLTFTTYDELLQLLVRRVIPDDDTKYESFVQFARIIFDCDEYSVSFSRAFIAEYLNSKELKQMKSQGIEPITLWHAIIVIKSSAKCALTKKSLSLDDYIALPSSFGLTETQRRLCYEFFIKYEQWRYDGRYWDEMDRVQYVMMHGPTVFRDDKFIPWAERVNRFGEMDLLDDEGVPMFPFFFDTVCADEAQDFTEIDLVLFSKMSASIRSLFLSADVAQSVEVGINMRAGTVNDVFHSLVKDGKHQVKEVLQYIDLKINHRTHAQNLAIGLAVRRILARSFQIPMTNESALITGEIPKTMMINKVCDLVNPSIFQGGNIVFLAPDEKVHQLRLQFQALKIHNDVFGAREAKGLEFDACALIGFFTNIEEAGSKDEWLNALRWLSSSSSLTKTASTGEKVDGLMLTDCDYRLSAPNVSDEAMMLYTALTRARNHLYLIEIENTDKGKRQGQSLAQFAFRRLKDLGLAKPVEFIKEGHVEMTPAEHKARGILYVTTALNMTRNKEPFSTVKDKLLEAMSRFAPDKGNDKDLLDKCEKHLNALTDMNRLLKFAKENFLRGGKYDLQDRFVEVLEFECMASDFFSRFLCDSFLAAEVQNVRMLIEEVVDGTPYESHFKNICTTIKVLEKAV